jgi:hypothetical protein
MFLNICRDMRNKTIYLILLFLMAGLVVFSQTQSKKRGLAYAMRDEADMQALNGSITWHYNWSMNAPNPSIDAKYNTVHIPMVWNGNISQNDKQKVIDYAASHPECEYLLAFNEPNLGGGQQANLSPQQAAKKWYIVKEVAQSANLKIISPGMAAGGEYEPISWLQQFFAQPEVDESEIVGIAFHNYNPGSGSIESEVNKYKNAFPGKELWLTEFCAWEGANINPAGQRRYLCETFHFLENEPAVTHYSWFTGRGWDRDNPMQEGMGYPYMQLFKVNQPGILHDIGVIFANMSSYDESFYFNVNTPIPAAHYANCTKGIILEVCKQTEEAGGPLYITQFLSNRWIDYNIEVPSAQSYELQLRVATDWTSDVEIHENGAKLQTVRVENTGSLTTWTTLSTQITLSPGKHTLRFISKGELNLKWLSFTPASAIHSIKDEPLAVYPNPVTDKLYLKNAAKAGIMVFDLSGKKIIESKHASSVDLSACKAGIYLVAVQSESGEKSIHKIVKD